jgi:actin-like ATPase involved in cell morphogenesis
MSYQLGIDLGTTYTAAAISRASERSSGVDVVTLGSRSATVASVMYLADDGSVLVGEAAERRALTDPDRVVREFKRRVGDEIPLMLGGRPFQAHELAARLVRWVVDLVSEREGGAPRRIAVTHPASWGAHKKDLFSGALRNVGLTVTFLAEPQAAAVSYASAERVEEGSTVAVYDLGGGTFDAAVVRKTGNGTFELLGQPEGIERLGGIDFDEVVFAHVREAIGSKLEGLDPEDPDVLSAVARLRRECVEAKEALSSDTEATIPVLLPELRTQSRLTRGEFEAMIRPALEETVLSLRRAVVSAGLTPDDLTAVLLVGGSSRIPLVSQLVSDELSRPVAVDADPKTAIAMGAALAISPQPAQVPVGPPPPSARHSGAGYPPARGASRAGAAGMAGATGVAAAGAAAYGASRAAKGGSGGGGRGSGGPAGGPPPPRPAVGRGEPPPRPDTRPAAYSPPGGHAGHQDGYYGQPKEHKQTGLYIGIGGVIAIAAILALVMWWPSSSNDSTGGASSSSSLTPAEQTTEATAPAQKTTEPHRATPRATKQQQAPVKESPATSKTAPPTSSHQNRPTLPTTPALPTGTAGDNNGGGSQNGGGQNGGNGGAQNGGAQNGTQNNGAGSPGAGNPGGQTGGSTAQNSPAASQGGASAAEPPHQAASSGAAPRTGWAQPSTGWAKPGSVPVAGPNAALVSPASGWVPRLPSS